MLGVGAAPIGRGPTLVGKDDLQTRTPLAQLDQRLLDVAALPFQHDIHIAGLGRVGSTRHLPPVVSLQYHFNGQGTVSPFVGAGVNYTTFFSEKTGGALAGSTLRLKDSWGLAAHAGVDVRLSERGALRLDMRWIDIDSTVKLDGQRLGSVRIDPLVYGAAYVFTF